jgi:hypothetical protein
MVSTTVGVARVSRSRNLAIYPRRAPRRYVGAQIVSSWRPPKRRVALREDFEPFPPCAWALRKLTPLGLAEAYGTLAYSRHARGAGDRP